MWRRKGLTHLSVAMQQFSWLECIFAFLDSISNGQLFTANISRCNVKSWELKHQYIWWLDNNFCAILRRILENSALRLCLDTLSGTFLNHHQWRIFSKSYSTWPLDAIIRTRARWAQSWNVSWLLWSKSAYGMRARVPCKACEADKPDISDLSIRRSASYLCYCKQTRETFGLIKVLLI